MLQLVDFVVPVLGLVGHLGELALHLEVVIGEIDLEHYGTHVGADVLVPFLGADLGVFAVDVRCHLLQVLLTLVTHEAVLLSVDDDLSFRAIVHGVLRVFILQSSVPDTELPDGRTLLWTRRVRAVSGG